MPATALEAACGLTEHQHSEGCYGTKQVLSCGLEEGAVAEDGEEHTHDDSCYENGEVLTCTKTEHVHTEDCYAQEEDEQSAQSAIVRKVQAKAQEEETLSSQDEGQQEADDGQEPESKETSLADAGKTSIAIDKTGDQTEYDKDKGEFYLSFIVNFKLSGNSIDKDTVYTYSLKQKDSEEESITILSSLVGTEYTGKDSEGKEAFKYWFVQEEDGTYSIKLQFLPAYKVGTSVNGHISFYGYAKTDTLDNDGNIKILFEDGSSITIPSTDINYPDDATANYDISVTKSKGNINMVNGTITYTATIRSTKGTPGPIAINDILKAEGLDFSSVAITKIEKAGGSFVQSPDSSNCDGNTAIYDLTLPKLDPDTGYTITYVYTLKSLPYEINTNAYNTITVTSSAQTEPGTEPGTDPKPGETLTATADSTTPLEWTMLTKGSNYDEAKGIITWTIQVNLTQIDIAGKTLSDSMFSDAMDGANGIKVKRMSDGTESEAKEGIDFTFVRDGNGMVTAITFNKTDGNENRNIYVITYTTSHEHTLKKEEGENVASLDGVWVVRRSYTIRPYKGYLNKERKSVSKLDSDGNFTINWELTYQIPSDGIAEGTTIIDTARTGENSMDLSRHWFTGAQIKALLKEYKENKFFDPYDTLTVELKLYETKDKNAVITSEDDIVDSAKYYGIRITFVRDVTDLKSGTEDSYVVRYSTTANAANIANSQRYYNLAEFGDVTSPAEYTYYRKVAKLNGNGAAADQEIALLKESQLSNSLYWYVRVTVNENDDDVASLTVEDTLPENVELLKVGIAKTRADAYKNLTAVGTDSVAGTVTTANGRKVTTNVDVSALLNISKGERQFFICYECKPLGDPRDEEDNSIAYENNVKVLDDSKKEYGSDTRTETVKLKKVNKTGEWNKNSQKLEYSITINPFGIDYMEGIDTITLTDELTYKEVEGIQITLDANSVELYTLDENGNEVAYTGDWTFMPQDLISDGNGNLVRTFTATIPDETKLVLKYKYNVICEDSTIKSVDLGNITNKMTLSGVSDASSSNKTSVKWVKTGTSAGITTSFRYTIHKIEEGNMRVALSGAEFTLYECNSDGTGTVVKDGDNDKIYTTDEDGTLVIVQGDDDNETDFIFKSNTIYYIQETKAPGGYELPDEPEKYYFYFSEDNNITIPDGIDTTMVTNLNRKSDERYVENALIYELAYELPESGGSGTRLFYIIGAILVLGSGILLISKKRAGSK
jgi:LPXTG-motif cell wall-anchored protein